MGFEKVVLNKVKNVLGEDVSAEFAYGSLFVACTEDEARTLFHRLYKDMDGKVRVSRTFAKEFAFDFVA